MALYTRLEPGVDGYDGFNLYSKDGTFIGDVVVVEENRKGNKITVRINAPDLKVVPKAIDQDDREHNKGL